MSSGLTRIEMMAPARMRSRASPGRTASAHAEPGEDEGKLADLREADSEMASAVGMGWPNSLTTR